MPSRHELIRSASSRLRAAGIENSLQEARWLWEFASGETTGQWAATLHLPAPDAWASDFQARLTQRCAGEPLAYVLGEWPFLGRLFRTPKGVLIPRPETEEWVATVINTFQRQDRAPRQVWDIGSGSGVIGISVALAFLQTPVWAWDQDPFAVKVSHANAQRLGTQHYHVRSADFFSDADMWKPLLEAIPDTLILSNPPYISDREFADLEAGVRDHEPAHALRGGTEGLDFYRRLFGQIPVTTPIGLEIGYRQGVMVSELARKAGFQSVRIQADRFGNDRVLLANWPMAVD